MRRLSKEEIPGDVIPGLTLGEMLKEGTSQKPPLRPYTIFVDLDGTLVKHNYDPGHVFDYLIPGAMETLKAWSDAGHKIIITTGRKKPSNFDQVSIDTGNIISAFLGHPVPIIWECTTGVRVLINDRSAEGKDKAFAINVNRNEGLAGVVLE